MKINKETCKGFWNRNKGTIIAVGVGLLAVAASVILLKDGSEDVECEAEALSNDGGWIQDSKWQKHCYKNNLLLNGLPIFADDEQMTIYKDAIDSRAIKEFEEDGFTIIDREGA